MHRVVPTVQVRILVNEGAFPIDHGRHTCSRCYGENINHSKSTHKYKISNEFSFHTMYYETSCVFYIPEPLARGYKTHNEFHNTSYGMKIHLRFFLSHELS